MLYVYKLTEIPPAFPQGFICTLSFLLVPPPPMSFFTSLPTELQISVLENLTSHDFKKFLQTSKYFNSLSLDVLSTKLNNNNSSSIYLSIYSPQNENKLIETFNTILINSVKNPSNTPVLVKDANPLIDMNLVSDKLLNLSKPSADPKLSYSTVLKLGDLKYTKNPLIIAQSDQPFDYSDSNNIHNNKINLILNEDEPYVNLHFEIKLKSASHLNSLFKFNTKLSPNTQSGVIYSDNNQVKINYNLVKGTELPPRSDYDYDVFYNYVINFGNININNLYLLSRIETSC